MTQTSVTVQAPDFEAARAQGATLFGVTPCSVSVVLTEEGSYTVSLVAPRPFSIHVSADRMAAFLSITAPCAAAPPVALEEVLIALAGEKVVSGIDREQIRLALAGLAQPGTPGGGVCIARGQEPGPGKDGALHFFFRLNSSDPQAIVAARGEGRLAEAGIIRDLVFPGDVLLEKIPGRPGVAGFTVTGEILAGDRPGDPGVTAGENVVVLEDGLTFIVDDTLVAGYADYADSVVSVADPMRVADDRMQVFMDFHPPARKGRGLSGELVVRMLKQHQIISGVKKNSIISAMAWVNEKKRPLCDIVIARGVPPVPGSDARLEERVSAEKTAGRLSAGTDRIDFRERNYINTVSKGEVLVRKIPATEGVDGCDLFSRTVPAEPGKDLELVAHTNVAVSEDGLALISEVDGMLFRVDREQFVVVELLEIQGDVDYSTGNLKMSGALFVKNWVRTGFVVRATGDIHIGGGVEDAMVLSAASIVIAGGVVGGDLGRIKAGGDITARFLEQARVQAKGSIFVHDLILRSTVSASGMLFVTSGKGCIRGGTVSALQGIEANEAGSEAGVKTVLMAGIHPDIRRRLAEYDAHLAGYRRERAKMDTVFGRYLAGSKGTALLPELMRKLSLLGKQRRTLVLAEARMVRAREELAREMAAIDPARVRIMIKKKVYANTMVVLNGVEHRVGEDILHPVVFVLDEEGRKVVGH